MLPMFNNKRQENIGLFNECFPPVMDGVSVCVQNYAYWMQKKVGGVCVITPHNHGVHYKEEYKILDYMSVPVPFRRPYVTGIPDIDPVFVRKLQRRRFKIVHAHSPFTSGLCALNYARSHDIPIIATFHSKYRDDFARVIPSKFAVDQIVRQIVDFYSNVDEVWVPQASVEDVIREYGYKGRVEVVDNGSDLCAERPDSYFDEARKSLGIGQDEFVMLFVGQHIWEKNVRLIIDSLEILKDKPFRMFFIGTGYAAEEMQYLVREKGLEPHVTFVGTLTDRAALTEYYAAADLFLFPSLYDNAPLVVREAAALRTPAVMAEGATASTIIRDGQNGYLVPNEAQAMASRLSLLMEDRDAVRKVGLEASHTIVRSWEDVVDEVLERYDALISRKKLLLGR